MRIINGIIDFIQNLTLEDVFTIWIAIFIAALFSIFRGPLAYIVVKMFKLKEKNPQNIKNNSFYNPLKTFFTCLGIYLAFVYLKAPFNINDNVMNVITKIFKIVVIVVTAKGLGDGLTAKSSFITKLNDLSDKDFDNGSLMIIAKIIKYIIYIIAAFLVVMELGYNLNGLIAGLGIGSVVITLAAQDTAKNLVGGLMIILDKPFKVGDHIIVGTSEGKVEDVSFRSTKIRTVDSNVIYIPNSVIGNTAVINCSEKMRTRYHNVISLDRDTKIEKVEECKYKIVKMLTEHDLVIQDTVNVRISEIAQNGIDIKIECYIDTPDVAKFTQIKEEFNYNILQICNEENVTIVGN